MQPANRLSTSFKQLINYTLTVKTSEVSWPMKTNFALAVHGRWINYVVHRRDHKGIEVVSFTNPRTIDLYRVSLQSLPAAPPPPPPPPVPKGQPALDPLILCQTIGDIEAHSKPRFPAPSSELCQNWLRHWRDTLYPRVSVHRRCGASRFGLVVRRKRKDLGSIPLRLSFLFKKVVVCEQCPVTVSITSYWNIKMALIAAHLNAGIIPVVTV